ncbi:unnamed protein product [Onchocerca flexuosa]|uniref:7TM_GPCR_Srx domain-containing protein n=1 Tax=Onchocerca flexuosa TaxID=387005 RepID=A0A183HGE0_9BILA|nr:unnamed protein product [Onchocerca flexuosa]
MKQEISSNYVTKMQKLHRPPYHSHIWYRDVAYACRSNFGFIFSTVLAVLALRSVARIRGLQVPVQFQVTFGDTFIAI